MGCSNHPSVVRRMSGEATSNQLWTPISGYSPQILRWEGEYIVFNPFSGKTHYLDTVASRVLMAVLQGPSSIEDVSRGVAGFLEVDDGRELRGLVAETLARLDELGLIEPAS